jgi:ketosteroid isomerase-like protein
VATTAERFMQALQTAEQQMNPTPVADLFTEEAELTNLAKTEPYRGREGAHAFWQEYLNVFQEIRSEFTNVIEHAGTAVLEWNSTGALKAGSPIAYRGVSILELQDDRVRGFRTYYDSGAFLPQPARQESTTDGSSTGDMEPGRTEVTS